MIRPLHRNAVLSAIGIALFFISLLQAGHRPQGNRIPRLRGLQIACR